MNIEFAIIILIGLVIVGLCSITDTFFHFTERPLRCHLGLHKYTYLFTTGKAYPFDYYSCDLCGEGIRHHKNGKTHVCKETVQAWRKLYGQAIKEDAERTKDHPDRSTTKEEATPQNTGYVRCMWKSDKRK